MLEAFQKKNVFDFIWTEYFCNSKSQFYSCSFSWSWGRKWGGGRGIRAYEALRTDLVIEDLPNVPSLDRGRHRNVGSQSILGILTSSLISCCCSRRCILVPSWNCMTLRSNMDEVFQEDNWPGQILVMHVFKPILFFLFHLKNCRWF